MDNHRFNDLAAHQASLRLLAEAAEYLGRLPTNALTRDLKMKIEAHLARPEVSVHAERLEAIAKDRDWASRVAAGESFVGVSRITPNGLPILQCVLLRGTIHFRSPAYNDAMERGGRAEAERMALAIGGDLAAGMCIHLRPTDKVLDKHLLGSWPKSHVE